MSRFKTRILYGWFNANNELKWGSNYGGNDLNRIIENNEGQGYEVTDIQHRDNGVIVVMTRREDAD